jgi:hypothetical protein
MFLPTASEGDPENPSPYELLEKTLSTKHHIVLAETDKQQLSDAIDQQTEQFVPALSKHREENLERIKKNIIYQLAATIRHCHEQNFPHIKYLGTAEDGWKLQYSIEPEFVKSVITDKFSPTSRFSSWSYDSGCNICTLLDLTKRIDLLTLTINTEEL